MKRRTLLSCFVWFMISCCGYGIDFTPSFGGYQSSLRPFFMDGKVRYGICLPMETTLTGSPAEADFSFNQLEGAKFRIKKSPLPLKPELAFSGQSLEAYRNTALSFVGGETEKLMVQGEGAGPLEINNWTSYRFTLSFEVPGRRFMQEITFLNVSPTDQWVLITTATEKRFEEAVAKSLSIMRSWRPLPANDDLSAPLYP